MRLAPGEVGPGILGGLTLGFAQDVLIVLWFVQITCMNYNLKYRLEFDQVVIVSTNDAPGLFFPAKVCQVFESRVFDKRTTDPTVTYQYSVRPVRYEEEPFKNFPMTETTYLTWGDLDSFSTIEDWIGNVSYYLHEVVEIKKRD